MFKRAAQGESQLSFVTVVTYGRTGSTVIQSALNALPGVLVRGENYGAIRGLREYLQSIAETADRHSAGKPDHPWYGSAKLDPEAVLADLRRHVIDFVLRPNRDTKVVGFKEIRYEPGHFAEYDNLLDYLLFLNKLLPGMRFLMNVRDASGAARSGWWPDNAQALEVLGTTRQWLSDAVTDINRILGADRAVLVDYEDWTADPEVLIDAFAVLGLPRDDAAVRAIATTRLEHGPHGSGEGTG
jgi:hypothetical protein